MIRKHIEEFDLQIKRARFWLKESKNFSNENTQMFAKFYFLWSAFNSLYNLEFDEFESESARIKLIIKLINENEANKLINDNSDEIMGFNKPVKDEKHRFLLKFNHKYEHSIENGTREYNYSDFNKIYSNPASSFNKKLEAVILTIYQIRNNLTHGNKDGNYRDIDLVQNSNPIIENLVNLLLEKLGNP